MRSLKDFRNTKRLVYSRKEINRFLDRMHTCLRIVGMELDASEDLIGIITYDNDNVFIEITDDHKYKVVIDRDVYESSNLAHLEEMLWDFWKWEIHVDAGDMEDDLHHRAYKLIMDNRLPYRSLDEISINPVEDLALFQAQQYLIEQFEDL